MKRKTVLAAFAVILFSLSFMAGCDGVAKDGDETAGLSVQYSDISGFAVIYTECRTAELGIIEILPDFSGYVLTEAELRKEVEEFFENKFISLRNRWDGPYVINILDSYTKKFEPGFVSKQGKPQASVIRYYIYIIEDPEGKKMPITALVKEDTRFGTLIYMGGASIDDPNHDFRMENTNDLAFLNNIIAVWNRSYLDVLSGRTKLLTERPE